MSLTLEKIERLPNVYKDFLLTLNPVVESRRDVDLVLRITGVPLSRIYEVISDLHGYELPQIREVAQNLKSKGYIDEDRYGFFSPTRLGEDAIDLILQALHANERPVSVPPLPELN